MSESGENQNFNNRFSDVKHANDFRGQSENNQRNSSLASAQRTPQSSITSKSGLTHGKTNLAENIKSKILDGIGNNESSIKSNFLNKGFNQNNNLNLRQKIARKGLTKAVSVVNPAAGAALKSKAGQRLLNVLQKRNSLFSSPLGMVGAIPQLLNNPNKKEEDVESKKDENRLENTTITISKKVKRILIPVGVSCALVMFGVCVIMVAAQSYSSVLGIDLSSQISMDEGNSEMTDANILNALEGLDTGATTINSRSRNNSVNVQLGEAASIEGQDARIEWLYDGNGVPQTEEENNRYLETFEVEILDGNGNPTTMNITMHKKLKTEVQQIFKEMKQAGFKIHGGDISYRTWGSDGGYAQPFYYSAHTYGHAFDVNPVENCYMPSSGGGCTVGDFYNPGVNEYSVTDEIVNIWKAHGFYWGGDWVAPIDYMHFSYFNH